VNTYYLNGYLKITATDDADALRRFEEAGLGIDVEIADGVTLDFQGPWDEIAREPSCICPPELRERGGFKGGCPVHA
jgi:hypothetical protein